MTPSQTLRAAIGSGWLRAAAVVCVFLIAFLSLIPGRWQERTTLPGPLEHFGAYLITAMIVGIATRRRRNPLFIAVALTTVAAVLEVLQFWSPGRDPQFVGFGGSAAGAFTGALLANWIRPQRSPD